MVLINSCYKISRIIKRATNYRCGNLSNACPTTFVSLTTGIQTGGREFGELLRVGHWRFMRRVISSIHSFNKIGKSGKFNLASVTFKHDKNGMFGMHPS